MNKRPNISGGDRRVFTGLFILGVLLFIAFFIGGYRYPELFSRDGSRWFLSFIPEFIWYFKFRFAKMGLALLAALLIIWYFRSFFDRHYSESFTALNGILVLLILGFAFSHYYQKDELEHIHTTWKMMGGARPFSDFFQHHHPLLWYQSLPAVKLLGASVETVLAMRFVQYLFLLGILASVYQIAILLTGSPEVGGLALLLLTTFKFFIETGFEIRPDVEQVFFCLFGYFFFLKYLQQPRTKYMVFSGLSMAVAFLYLQKALFFLFPTGLVFLYLLAAKKIGFRPVLIFSLAFLAPVALFLLYYYVSGQWEAYLLFNWVVNLYKTPEAHTWNHYTYKLIWNPFFLILMVLSTLYFFIRWKELSPELKINFFVGLVLFLIAFTNPRAWKQYYLPAFPLIAISSALMLRDWAASLRGYQKLILCLGLIASALPIFMFDVFYPQNNKELYKAIRAQSESVDSYAFDEDLRQNLFQQDMHFFWYSTHRGRMYDSYRKVVREPKYRRLVKKRYDDLDFCRLVRQYQPRFIHQRTDSDHRLDNCGDLKEWYEETGVDIFTKIED